MNDTVNDKRHLLFYSFLYIISTPVSNHFTEHSLSVENEVPGSKFSLKFIFTSVS
jgi:hypothetical protein